MRSLLEWTRRRTRLYDLSRGDDHRPPPPMYTPEFFATAAVDCVDCVALVGDEGSKRHCSACPALRDGCLIDLGEDGASFLGVKNVLVPGFFFWRFGGGG